MITVFRPDKEPSTVNPPETDPGTTTTPETKPDPTPTNPTTKPSGNKRPPNLPSPPPGWKDPNSGLPGYGDVRPGRTETPSDTVWFNTSIRDRGTFKEAVDRVIAMSTPSHSGGIQAEEHSSTSSSVYNNLRSIDWAIWELLIILSKLGYGEVPH